MGYERQQPCATAGAAALDRSDGDTEDFGGFRDRVALHVDEYEGRPLFGGKLGEGGDELPVEVPAFGGESRGLMRFQEQIQALGVVGELGAAGGGLARPVEARVDGDAVQPGRDGGLAAEGVGCAVRGDQGVLYRVGGLFAVAEGAYRHGPQPVAVPSYEFAEGFGIAFDVPGEEFPVVR
jgi:hypothetical protein